MFKRGGFTLLEIMVAFTILVIGLMALVPISVFMLKSNMHNRRLSQAKSIAERYSEGFRAIDYLDAQLSDDADTTDLMNISSPDHADTIVQDNQQYFVYWNIANNMPKTGVKTVNIIISWDDRAAKKRMRIDYRTFKAAVSR